MAEAGPISIAYVGGSPRSGSTILAHLIAETFDGVVVGELKDVWHRGPLENQRCSCGHAFRSCDFWTEVGRRAFGGWDNLPLQNLTTLQRRIDRFRTLPMLLLPAVTRRCDPQFSSELSEYRETLVVLYHALQTISGRSLIVESSKHPAQAFVLSSARLFEPRVIHLVRDSRGVAWSFQKQVVRPEITDRRQLMPRAAPATVAWQWMTINLPFHLLWSRSVPRLLVRYEGYVTRPAEELDRIGRFLARPGMSSLPQSSSGLKLDFAAEHSLGGNPVRFNGEGVDLRIDEEWRTAMRIRDQIRVGALTFPLLAAYGYVRGTIGDE